MKLNFACLTLCLGLLNFTAAKDARTVIVSMDDLRHRVEVAHDVFKTYDGGVVRSINLGKAAWDVYASTKQARSSWEEAPPFDDGHVPDILTSYHSLRRSITDVLETSRSKGPDYEKAGIRLLMLGMMQFFENERREFLESARNKIPESFHGDISGPVMSLSEEFQTTMKALA